MGVANGQLIEGRVSRGSRIPLAQPGYLMLHMPHGYLVRIMNIQSPLFSIPSYLRSHCGSSLYLLLIGLSSHVLLY